MGSPTSCYTYSAPGVERSTRAVPQLHVTEFLCLCLPSCLSFSVLLSVSFFFHQVYAYTHVNIYVYVIIFIKIFYIFNDYVYYRIVLMFRIK